ncbi:DUF3042 family protein [Companilactobacillus sp. HBUAS56275]|uniref:DUF3042 family protein n=1 Tax=Candidatus Companilactobacillus pullicola TaxID=2838523 RepID=A0A9D1ZMR0_9LACO|nr:DUF3042 family protein [Candidatus Companilactobacillus pullicola]
MAKNQKHFRFVKGFLVGSLTTATAVYGALHAFKKKVIEPENQENERVEENRRRANRKSLQAHQG